MSAYALLLRKGYQTHPHRQVHQAQPDALVDNIASLQPPRQVVVLLLLPIHRAVAGAPPVQVEGAALARRRRCPAARWRSPLREDARHGGPGRREVELLELARGHARVAADIRVLLGHFDAVQHHQFPESVRDCHYQKTRMEDDEVERVRLRRRIRTL